MLLQKNVSCEATGEDWWQEIREVSSGFLGDPRIRVAVIDGPVDVSHPCFAGAVLERLEMPSAGSDNVTAAAHGTSVASVILGQRGSLVEGVVPHCHGLLVPVLRARDGVLAASQLDLARGISLALAHGAAVINISAGQLDPSGEPHPYLAEMVRRCQEHGVLIVAAAGNDGCACLHVPAAATSVLAVGAMDDCGNPLPSSNWGKAYRDHAILAPGKDIPGAAPDSLTALYHGTSWATAIVSGFSALLLSAQVKRGERPDAARVRAAILETALGCGELPAVDCDRLLAGRLNITGAWMRLINERRKVMAEEMQRSEPGVGVPEPPPPRVESAGLVAESGQIPREGPLSAAPPMAAVTASGCGCGGQSQSGESSCSCGGKGGSASGECTCGGKKSAPSQVYVLGQLGYDLGTEARRDSLIQRGIANPYDPRQLLSHLQENPVVATAVIWTLIQDGTPIYAIQPMGPFAAATYDLLQRFLKQQLDEGVERISVPGWITGKVTLSNGQVLAAIVPEHRGMYSWSTAALLEAVLGKPPATGDGETAGAPDQAGELANFLDRIYYEVRNLGILPQERAMNYAATNALQLGDVYSRTAKAGLKLDSIGAERSPICRPESDCWDVKLTFFHPAKRLEQAREVYRLTVDVSDVVPVTVGPVRSWYVY